MRSVFRTAAMLAATGVIFGSGIAAGAAGTALLLGQTNDAGTKQTTIQADTASGVLRAKQLGSGAAIVAQGPKAGVGIELRSGALRVAGAGLNSKTAAFVIGIPGHEPSDPGNCYPNAQLSTVHRIDNPYLNGKPGAMLFLEARAEPNGSGRSLGSAVYLESDTGDCAGGYWYVTNPDDGMRISALVVIP